MVKHIATSFGVCLEVLNEQYQDNGSLLNGIRNKTINSVTIKRIEDNKWSIEVG